MDSYTWAHQCWLAKSYIHKDSRCRLAKLPRAIHDRDGWCVCVCVWEREREREREREIVKGIRAVSKPCWRITLISNPEAGVSWDIAKLNSAYFLQRLRRNLSPYCTGSCPSFGQQDVFPYNHITQISIHIQADIFGFANQSDLIIQLYVYVCIYPPTLAGAGCDIRLIFKRSLTGLNSEFSFS